MENFDGKNKKMIGGRVPINFAEKFTNYCGTNGINRSVLFHNITKWWLELPEPIQWLIYRGKVSEAHEQIAKAFASQQAAIAHHKAAVSASEESKRKQGRRRASKIG